MKLTKIRKFWYFRLRNGVIRKGESKDGAFKWRFRRFWLDVETASGNWKARWTAAEHPFGYLLSSNNDEQVHGFAYRMYMIGALLTTDQKFVDQIDRAIRDYDKRLGKAAEKEAKTEDEIEEKAALEFEKGVQEYVERKRGKKAARSLQ